MESNVAVLTKPRTDAGRAPEYCQLTYTYEDTSGSRQGHGFTRDLSKKGCGVRGSIMPPIGVSIHMTLDLGDDAPPISVEATVKWTVAEFFGVEFTDIQSKDYVRIRRYMWTVLNQTT